MKYERLTDKRILLIEDDPSMLSRLSANLKEVGCQVEVASDVESAIALVTEADADFDVAIVDLYIPRSPGDPPDRVMRGEDLAIRLHDESPRTRFVSISGNLSQPPHTDLARLFTFHVFKPDIPYHHDEPPVLLLEMLDGLFASPEDRLPKVFIVHGHDDTAVFELKDYIVSTLQLGHPVVLRDAPSFGKTIIEKFEHEAKYADIVFVLLTPDDGLPKKHTSKREMVYRARQNVIFEMGFFYAKLQRTRGHVIVLKKGDVELPSDLSGVVYIDISNGVRTAGEEIRTELKAIGWLH